jgi:hypothetical protein
MLKKGKQRRKYCATCKVTRGQEGRRHRIRSFVILGIKTGYYIIDLGIRKISQKLL